MDGVDGVVDLTVANQLGFSLGVPDKTYELALLLHIGLILAVKLDLAGRVDCDCGDLLGLHVQDDPV